MTCDLKVVFNGPAEKKSNTSVAHPEELEYVLCNRLQVVTCRECSTTVQCASLRSAPKGGPLVGISQFAMLAHLCTSLSYLFPFPPCQNHFSGTTFAIGYKYSQIFSHCPVLSRPLLHIVPKTPAPKLTSTPVGLCVEKRN